MTPAEAWAFILTEFQNEVPKASFARYLAPLPLPIMANGCATLFVPDADAQAWLTQRCARILQHKLRGYFPTQAIQEVRFVVRAQEPPPPQPTQDRAETGAGEVNPQTDADTQRVHLEAALAAQLAARLRRPERVVVVPGYLRRWLPFLGPNLFLLLLAFRQAHYLATGHAVEAGRTFSAPATTLAKWAGLSLRTVRNHLAEPRLAWFLHKADEKTWMRNPRTGRAQQAPGQYTFHTPIPLTPQDAEFLSRWFQAEGLQDDPAKVLTRACAIPRQDFFPAPGAGPAPPLPAAVSPHTLTTLIEAHCPALSSAQRQALAPLIAQLEAHLCPPTDQIIIPWYFIHHWIPQLKAAPSVLVILLRDACFWDATEVRDTVWIPHGAQSLANQLGLRRAKTIEEWFPAQTPEPARPASTPLAQRRQKKQQLLGRFLQRVETRVQAGVSSWKFQVARDEPLPEREAFLVSALARILTLGHLHEAPTLLPDFLAQAPRAEAQLAALPARSAPTWEVLRRELHALTQHGGAFCTLIQAQRGANCTQTAARFAAILKLLIKNTFPNKTLEEFLKALPEKTPSTTPQPTEASPPMDPLAALRPEAGGAGQITSSLSWDYDKLLQMGGLNAATRRQVQQHLRRDPAARARLLAWGLYGFAQQGITSPLLFATTRYRETHPAPAYQALAEHDPETLLALVAHPRYNTPRAQTQILEKLRQSALPDLLEGLLPHEENFA